MTSCCTRCIVSRAAVVVAEASASFLSKYCSTLKINEYTYRGWQSLLSTVALFNVVQAGVCSGNNEPVSQSAFQFTSNKLSVYTQRLAAISDLSVTGITCHMIGGGRLANDLNYKSECECIRVTQTVHQSTQ